MSVTNILFLDHSRKNTRTINFKPVIKHFYLNISSFYPVIPMRNCIYNKFRTNKLAVFFFGNKNSVIAEICSFFHLILNECYSFFYLFKNSSFKDYIFNNIHIFSYQRFNPIITDKANERPWEKELRLLSKKQNSSN